MNWKSSGIGRSARIAAASKAEYQDLTDDGAQFAPKSDVRVSTEAILKNLGGVFLTMAKLVYGLNQSLNGTSTT